MPGVVIDYANLFRFTRLSCQSSALKTPYEAKEGGVPIRYTTLSLG